jgi:hypothetical protein
MKPSFSNNILCILKKEPPELLLRTKRIVKQELPSVEAREGKAKMKLKLPLIKQTQTDIPMRCTYKQTVQSKTTLQTQTLSFLFLFVCVVIHHVLVE